MTKKDLLSIIGNVCQQELGPEWYFRLASSIHGPEYLTVDLGCPNYAIILYDPQNEGVPCARIRYGDNNDNIIIDLCDVQGRIETRRALELPIADPTIFAQIKDLLDC